MDTLEQAQFSRDIFGDLLPRLNALGIQLEPAEIFEVVVEA